MQDHTQYPRTPWIDEVSELLLGFAADDIRAIGSVRPALAACRDGREVLIAWLRPFEPGAYDGPVIEIAALAVPLGANQLAVLTGARAWSLKDPVAPVADGADLRQQVAMVTAADGSRSPVATATALQPYDVGGPGGVCMHDRVRLGAGEGWLSQSLGVFVSHRPPAELTTPERLAGQAARVLDRGHDLWMHPEVAFRLGARHAGRRGSTAPRSG